MPLPSASATTSPQKIDVESIQADLNKLADNIGKAVYGKQECIHFLVTTLIGAGHMLIEDVPGVGKTTMAVALAKSIGGQHQRIQFTSDLLPSDVIGVPIFDQQLQRFEFKQGPIFANVVLADEINRTTPKTQSCMLEAMQDGKISVDRQVHVLPKPFMVIATQNPIEHHGTYPLPESQLDRFMMRIEVGYPDHEYEMAVLQNPAVGRLELSLDPVCSPERILEIQSAVDLVQVDESLRKYILEISTATRKAEEIELGVSTRGSLMLHRAAQAWALLHGRDYCIPDDIKQLVTSVLAHRIIVRASFRNSLPHSEHRRTAELLLDRILSEIEVPR